MTEFYNNILSNENIDYILNNPEVIKQKQRIDQQNSGSIYFTIELTESIKTSLETMVGLNLTNINNIPMRWIKGDTAPHIDRGVQTVQTFNNTYLVYLTDNDGNLLVEGTTYLITKGTGYVFNEGLYHETINTGIEPRLIIGPMSEEGFAVGINQIIAPGGSTIYIRQINSSADIEYSYDQTTWNVLYLAVQVYNSDISLGTLTIEFITDITIDQSYKYFMCGSSDIQFGTRYLKENGSRPNIIFTGLVDYLGFIQNGYEFGPGYNNIYVYNLNCQVANNSTLLSYDKYGGYLCQPYFGNGQTNNYIINCSCNLDGTVLPTNCGGILGSSAGQSGNLKIINCNATNGIAGTGAGGIAGYGICKNGTVEISYCWSDLAIANDGGGIVGCNSADADGDSATLSIISCYTTGENYGGGGIIGSDAGIDNGIVNISNCYTTGFIGNLGGGIVGQRAGNNNGTVIVSNCYTTGSIDSQDAAGGICGYSSSSVTISHCYVSGSTNDPSGYIIGGLSTVNNGTSLTNNYSEANNSSSGWNTTHANSVLTGIPTTIIGSTWVASSINNPYELFNMGYSPYSLTNILLTPSPSLNKLFTTTINAGDSTTGGSLSNYNILDESPSSSNTITINSNNGVVSTTSNTTANTYTLYIRNLGSYNITTMSLTVLSSIPTPVQNFSSFRRLHAPCHDVNRCRHCCIR